ncbi:binding protein [Amanita rubescens]|nr:binding protein [Amanita rubescens]
MVSKMKEIAEAYLSEKVTHASSPYQPTTKDAGTIAGLKVPCIINKPTAAAIAYGLNKKKGKYQIIVYDLSGGTFDVSLLSIDDSVFEVLATAGDTHLGGYKKAGADVTKNPRALGKLKREVEKTKRLSSQQSVRIEIESFEDGNGLSETLTCAKFEEINMDLFRQTLKPVEKVLKDANVKKEDGNEVVLQGNYISERMQLLMSLFSYSNLAKKNCEAQSGS